MPRRKKDTSSSYFRTNAPPPRRRGLRHPKWTHLIDFCHMCEKEVHWEEGVNDEDGNLVHQECIEKRDADRRRLAQSEPEQWMEDLE